MQTRTALLIGGLALAIGWLAGSNSAPRQAPDDAVRSRGPRPLGVTSAPTPYTEELRLRLQERPKSPSTSRNPFSYGSARPAAVGRSSRPAEAAATPEPPPIAVAPPPRVRFELSGIAANTNDGATVRTAILLDYGSLTLVKVGDTLDGGFTVARIDEASVTLLDAAGAEQTLHLK